MPTATVTRVAATVLAATLLGLLPAPTGAYADELLTLEEETSSTTDTLAKEVTVTCPRGTWVVAVGGWTTGGGGRALLTRMEPSDDLTSAVVAARPGVPPAGGFSLTAQAMCLRDETPPERVEDTVSGDSIVATCPDEHQAVGYGFAMHRSSGDWRLDELRPGNALVRVRAQASGTRPALAQLTVVGICLPSPELTAFACTREQGPSTPVLYPRTVVLPEPDYGYLGIGGSVTGAGTHLDRFQLKLYGSGEVRASRYLGLSLPLSPAARSGAVAAADEETAESMTGWGSNIGTFYTPGC
ncbi:hypothetical protein CS0771_44390 [Catellatospora sp. IY07-71]|uniref:hypothetical protein n=1 Tax=Catellatospora sp. IY07-71 TaxID=2728827 RepID=UPI001BB356D9|nr:hypothetical protein [Catellatospora sp. IY07-71]BCJ74895.1 hypothetical protein CS0771_44390 [Catellatospora sp. IY07-71]